MKRALLCFAAAVLAAPSPHAQSVAPALPLTASGDLSGFYPNPVVAPGMISNADLANAPTLTLKGNPAGSIAVEQDIPLGAGILISGGSLVAGGAVTGPMLPASSLSAASWGANGLQLGGGGVTCTDTSATGTVSSEGCFAFPVGTLAATVPHMPTVTTLYELYLPAPAAGTGVTATKSWSLVTAGGIKSNLGLDVSSGTINLNISTANPVNICSNTGCTSTVSIGSSANTTAIGGPMTLASTVNGLTLTALSTGFQIAGGTTSKTATFLNSLSFAGTDSKTMTFPSTSASIARTDAGQTFAGAQVFSGSISFGPDAASPVAKNVQGNNAAALNTDVAGGALYISGGAGTGTGVGGPVVIRTSRASSTGNSQNALTAAYTFDGNDHAASGGLKPVVTTCGTSFAIDSNSTDSAGQVTVGSGSPTSCVITFKIAYATYDHCVISPESALVSFTYSYSLTAITLGGTGNSLSGKVDYRCEGS